MTTSLSTATEATVPSGFAALNLSEPVLKAIEEVGYTEPTPVQAATYPIAISGRDIIVQARTGTGKTAAFGIPLVDKLVSTDPWVQALVLAPTRELAVQSQRELARLAQFKGLHTVAIYGGAPMGKQIDELKSGAQLVSGTPGRVLDHLRRGTFDPSRLKVLVLDEMDEMLSMGFAKELNAILDMLPPKGKRQTMCFSATVDGEIRRHAERHMHEPEMISLSSDAVSAAQITHQVFMVSGRDRIGDLVRILEVEDPDSAIVFCNMRSETERVAMGLKQAGFNADWLNGDLPQKDRERIMASTREGKLRYLVATDVAARGIDISHLTHVINFSFPESAAVYVHRTGRTGRAGRTGCAISLVGPEELGRLYYLRLEYKISPDERSLPTHGELKTRQETDRIGLLEAAFSDRASATDLSIARRLLTHPENERILAGLLHTFFGTKDDVDEEAAAARRSKPGPDVEAATRAPRERDRPGRERSDRELDRPRSRERDGRERETRGRDRDPARGRDRTREPDGVREGAAVQGGERDAEAGQLRDSNAERNRDRTRERDPRSRGRERDDTRTNDRVADRGVARSRDRDNERDTNGRTPDRDAARSRDRDTNDRTPDRDPARSRERDVARGREGDADRDAAHSREQGGENNSDRAAAGERDSDGTRSQGRERGDARARARDNDTNDARSGGRDSARRDVRSRDREAAPGRDRGTDGDSARAERESGRDQDSATESSPAREAGRERRPERESGRSPRGERDSGIRVERTARDGTREQEPGAADAPSAAIEGSRGRGARERGSEATRNSVGDNTRTQTRERQKSRAQGDEAANSPELTNASDGSDVAANPEDAGVGTREGRRRRSRTRGRTRTADSAQPATTDAADSNGASPAEEPAPRGRSRSAAAAVAKPLVAVDGELLPAESNGADPAQQLDWDEGEQASTELLEGLLYLNLGKRDGVRVPDVARLLRDSCELSRGQIGRIRVRDRYTFVDVPEERLDSIITALSGQVLHDKPLAPERAKTAKS